MRSPGFASSPVGESLYTYFIIIVFLIFVVMSWNINFVSRIKYWEKKIFTNLNV